MTIIKQQNARARESGNVLFLILIAVALFAALSYAVTQSSRSGGGDASSEKNLVNSSQVTQYPSGVRTSIVRMIVSSGVTVDELIFNDPSNFPAVVTAVKTAQSVFYPTGGGATYQIASKDAIDSAAGGQITAPQVAGQWIFSSRYQVQNIGITNAAANDGNDIIAFLPYAAKSLCLKLDSQLGIILSTATDAPTGDIATMPTLAADNMDLTHTSIQVGAPTATIGSTPGSSFTGQPFGCMKVGSYYLYYHVLVER